MSRNGHDEEVAKHKTVRKSKQNETIWSLNHSHCIVHVIEAEVGRVHSTVVTGAYTASRSECHRVNVLQPRKRYIRSTGRIKCNGCLCDKGAVQKAVYKQM